jgi:hypothetical protein
MNCACGQGDNGYAVAGSGHDVVEGRLTSEQSRVDEFGLGRVPTVLRAVGLFGVAQNLAVGRARGILGIAHGAPHSERHDRREHADDDEHDQKFDHGETVRTARPSSMHASLSASLRQLSSNDQIST